MKSMLLLAFSLAVPTANAQWQILDSHTTADLHGIDSLGSGVAWASGSNSTVLHTLNGRAWQTCAVPADGAALDFRSIQGLDEKTAVVMATGKGELSRLYKTTDGCQTWKKVFENPNATGSFESLHRATAAQMYLLGDPVNGKLAMFTSGDAGNTWSRLDEPGLEVPKGAGTAAVSSAAVTNVDWLMAFGTSGPEAAVYTFSVVCKGEKCSFAWVGKATPLAQSSPTAGVFSVSGRTYVGPPLPYVTGDSTSLVTTLVAVGGDSKKPADKKGSAAVSTDGGATWKPAGMPPNGYRSAVVFDPDHERFIAVGPNGTDISKDDGVAWQALKPGSGDVPEADQHWSTLSLPFVVGPHGRIGTLRDYPGALEAKNLR